MQILGLCNPQSGARPERLESLRQFAREVSSTQVQMTLAATQTVAEAEQALRDAQLGGDDLLLLSGGDGTIQHALCWLLHGELQQNQKNTRDQPTIALLPAGSTNMTATDMNNRRDWQQCLAAFQDHIDTFDRRGSEPLAVKERSLINVRDGDTTRAGFFVGGGAIVRGIEYCNHVLWAKGAARQERTAGLAMARTIWGVLRKQPPFDDIDEIRVTAALADGTSRRLTPELSSELGALLFAVSSLERLIVGVKPFWGSEQDEPMPFVLVERDAKLARNLPGLLGVSGFKRPVASRGFHSHNCTHLELFMESAYAIDGELFMPKRGQLSISLSEPLRFLEL